MAFQFPTDYDSPDKLLELIGSHWAGTYQGRGFVKSLVGAVGHTAAQNHLDFLELLAAVSRFKVPVFHTENWFLLELPQSELNQTQIPKWNGLHQFDTGLLYDVPLTSVAYGWQLPQGLRDFKIVQSGIVKPGVCYTYGNDFVIQNGVVYFRENPFDNPNVVVRTASDKDGPVEQYAGLWVYRGQFDLDTVYKQFGYVIGLRLESDNQYKQLVNCIYDALVEGSTVRAVEDYLATCCDAPLAHGGETVEVIRYDSNGLTIITDLRVYRYGAQANPLVAVGDLLEPGQALTDAVVFYEFNRGEVPAELRALTLGRGMLAEGYLSGLTFENKTVSLNAQVSYDGITSVRFEIQGFEADIEKFWDDVDSRGVTLGKSFAACLDTRPVESQDGNPPPLALPSTVNPLEFLLKNIYRDNLVVVIIRPAAFGPDAAGLSPARLLRKLVPPTVVLCVLIELAYDVDSVTLDGTNEGNTTTPGYAEELVSYTGNTTTDDIAPDDYVTEEVTFRYIGGKCQ